MASKRNRKKVKFKWTKELIILLVALATLLTVTIILAIPSQDKKNLSKWNDAITAYNTENSTSYSTLASTDNHLKEVGGSDESHFKKARDLADTEGYTYFFYGSLTNATFLEQLSKINTVADNYEIENVYVLYATFYEEAQADNETDTVSFKQKCDAYEDILNSGKNGDATEIDLTVYPALFVYKNNSLIFNTQVGKDSEEYSWSIYIRKAFSFEMNEKAKTINNFMESIPENIIIQ